MSWGDARKSRIDFPALHGRRARTRVPRAPSWSRGGGLVIRRGSHRPIVFRRAIAQLSVAGRTHGYVKATAGHRRHRRRRHCRRRRRRRRLPGRERKKGYQHQGLDCFFFLRPIFPPEHWICLSLLGGEPRSARRSSAMPKYAAQDLGSRNTTHAHTHSREDR